jgi:saccharopine dehydrogenase-like NADP-dependent oxidoreductase
VRVVVAGLGAVGGRVARMLAASEDVTSLVLVHRDPRRARGLADELGARAELRQGLAHEVPDADVTVLATPGSHRRATEAAVGRGSHVIAVTDDPNETRTLLGVDGKARAAERAVVVGAAMAPGLTCVMAAMLGGRMTEVEEVHVASYGTGGPACARRHHGALTSPAHDWEDGEWRRRPGGSGRELVWFPDPVGGADCYRAGLADPLLLVPAFPGVRRVTARLEATRRDRLTSWLPMLRPPHPEGLVGAVRVEVRGRRDGRAVTEILGSVTRPGVAAAAVASQAAICAGSGRLVRDGAGGLAELVAEPGAFLRQLSGAGITVAAFRGGYSDS